ncbi:hypothetical protein VPH35_112979 [Triticum aestivum]
MEDGDVYDCIDLNEQPAFNHPLLKDHKIQMKPSSFPIWTDIQTLPLNSFSQVQPSLIECPAGTIPILHSNISGTIAMHNIDGPRNNMQWERAGITYKGDVYGTRVVLNVWEPKVNREMQNGGGERADRMGVGLRVYPTLSGDTSVRFHVAWYEGLYKKGCIDFSCPGFVQVDRKIGLGSKIRPLSIYDGPQRIANIQIFKDVVSKNWWVAYEHTPIGYWPNGLFEFLRDKGDFTFRGGFVAGPTASSKSPQMGSGHYASEGFKRAAYIRNIEIVEENGKSMTPDESHVEHGSSDSSKYTVHRFEVSKQAGMHIYYGGPGSDKAR